MSSQIVKTTVRRSRRIIGAGALAGIGVALAAASTGVALAQNAPGVSYTLNVSESGLKNGSGALKTDVVAQGAMALYDTTVKLPNGSTFHVVNLLDGTSGKLTTIDPALKIYTVSDATQVRPEIFGTGTLLPSFTDDGRGLIFPLPDTRTAALSGGVGVAVAVIDKGMETVGKTKNAHHYTVALTYTTSGGAEVPYPAQTFDVWTDDSQTQPINAIDARLLGGGAGGAAIGGVTYTLTGDIDKLRAALSAVPVQMSYATGGAAGTVTYVVDKVSAKAVDAKTFDAPDAGKLRQVAAAEFSDDERSALVARIQNSNDGYASDANSGIRSTTPGSDPKTQGVGVPQTIGGG